MWESSWAGRCSRSVMRVADGCTAAAASTSAAATQKPAPRRPGSAGVSSSWEVRTRIEPTASPRTASIAKRPDGKPDAPVMANRTAAPTRKAARTPAAMPTASPSALRPAARSSGHRNATRTTPDPTPTMTASMRAIQSSRMARSSAMITKPAPTRRRPASWGPSATFGVICGTPPSNVAATAVRPAAHSPRPRPTRRHAGATGPRVGAPGEEHQGRDEGRAREDPGRGEVRGHETGRHPRRDGADHQDGRDHWRRAGAPWLVGPPTEAMLLLPSFQWSTAYLSSPRGGEMGRGRSSTTPRIGISGTDCRHQRASSGRSARTIARQSASGRRRSALRSACRRLSLSRRRTLARVGLVGRRGASTRSAVRSRSREAALGQLPVAGLRTLVGGDHPDLRSQALEEAGSLAGPERRRAGDVEADLDPGVGGVGVLPARTAGATEPPASARRRGITSDGETRSRPGSSAIGPA